MRSLLIIFSLSVSLYGRSQDTTIYEWCETEAEYPGGESEMMKFLIENFQYPEAPNDCLSIIYIEFVVEKDGSITNIQPAREKCPELEKAAIEVISKMPDWFPATKGNEAVRSKFTLPLHIHPK